MRYLYLTILWGMALLPGFAQTSSELTDEDKREIKAEAKKVIETHLSDLLNTIASDGMGEQGRKLIMANSFIPSENQIFDINSIIEDDVNPEFTISKKGFSDVKVQRYLENLNLFYTKSGENSIKITEVNATDVKKGPEYPFLLVHFKSHFTNVHRNKPTVKYVAILRTAELKAEKVDKQWRVLITGIRYYKEPVAENTVAKVPAKQTKPASPAATKPSEQVAQKPKEVKKVQEPVKDVVNQQAVTKTETPVTQSTKQESLPAVSKQEEVVKPAEKSRELVPQKTSPAIAELELQAAKYKKKTTLFRVGAGAAIVGAAATFVIVNGAYGDYKSQLEKSNSELETWWTGDNNGGNFGDIENYKAQPKSLISFGSPGIYFVGAGAIASGVLWFMGSANNKKAKDIKNQIEQKRKQLSITPQLSGSQRYAGIYLRYQF
jgi:outer membrane biosynthesis protein TonB